MGSSASSEDSGCRCMNLGGRCARGVLWHPGGTDCGLNPEDPAAVKRHLLALSSLPIQNNTVPVAYRNSTIDRPARNFE